MYGDKGEPGRPGVCVNDGEYGNPFEGFDCQSCFKEKDCKILSLRSWLLTVFKMSWMMGKQKRKPRTLNCFQDLIDAGLEIKYTEIN